MRWPAIAIFLVGTAGCDKGDKPAPALAPAPPKSAVAPPIDAPAPSDAPTIDAPPPIPADLTAAPGWSGRSLYTGHIRGRAEHTTAKLQRVETRALLTLEVREQSLRLDGKDPDPFGPPVTRQILATYANSKLAYTDGKDPVSLDCAIKTVAVASASAVRVREGKGGCEGDQGKWSPRTTRKAKALVCGDPTSEIDPSFTFIEPPAPPIEWVWVNDDCSMQGGGYRDVPNDGSIASPR
jgi:hypothetical protein